MAFNPREIAKAGRRVYERHRQDFDRCYQGKYVLIDIRSEKVFGVARRSISTSGGPSCGGALSPSARGRASGVPVTSPAEWRRYAGRSIAATVPSYGSLYLRPLDSPNSSTL